MFQIGDKNMFELKPTKNRCPKCNGKMEEIYYYFGVIRDQCKKCGLIKNNNYDSSKNNN